MVCWCSGRDNNVISSEKSHIADIQFAYSLSSQCPFFSKSGIFSDPLVLGKNDFVGSNEHIPWVSYIKLHLKMSGVNQLQISPPPNIRPVHETLFVRYRWEQAFFDGGLHSISRIQKKIRSNVAPSLGSGSFFYTPLMVGG